MSYYSDEAKITFDEADEVVAQYIREYRHRRSQTHSKAVARAMKVDTSHHNLIRLDEALSRELEVSEKFGTTTTRYKL